MEDFSGKDRLVASKTEAGAIDALFSLAGRVALVTGGNGGLGMAVALALQSAGATAVVTGRNAGKNAAAASRFGSECVFEADVTDEAAVARTISLIIENFGRLDVLVNNAGGFGGGHLTDLSRESWDAVLASHLTGAFLCSKHVASDMIARGTGGKIINIGSMYSIFGPPDFADYAVAKTGMLGLTRALAVELGAHNIQVNAILPGWYETDLTRGMPATETGERIRRRTPAGRWGEPSDLAGTAIFLASRASDFVSGISIPVDGGYAVSERQLQD